MEVTGTLTIKQRPVVSTSANKKLRKAGLVPGNIYGKGVLSVPIVVKMEDLRRCLVRYGRSAVIQLNMESGEAYTVAIKEVQNEPVSGGYLHVDFQQISLKEELKTEVAIKIIGREILEGKKVSVNYQIDTIPVRGLPQVIPNVIEIDVTELEVGDSVFVKDIKLPEGVALEIDSELLILSVSEPKLRDLEVEETVAQENKEES
jgi:large subunit ribosomal protein L25